MDTKANNVIETFLFKPDTYHIIAVSPNSSKIVHGYAYDRIFEEKMYIDVWNFTKDSKINKKEALQLDDEPDEHEHENEHHIEFLDDSILIHACRYRVDLFKVENTGIIKLRSFSAVSEQGYINQVKDFQYISDHQLSLTVVDPKNFLLITSELHNYLYNSIDSFEIIMQMDLDEKYIHSQHEEIGTITLQGPRENLSKDISPMKIQNIQAKHVFFERPSSIHVICTWRNEKVGLLYDSDFCEYDLLTGKFSKIMSFAGSGYDCLDKMSYLGSDHVVLCCKNYFCKARVIIIDIKHQIKILDTDELKSGDLYKKFYCADVSEEGVVLIYKKYSLERFIGLFDLKTRKINSLIQIESEKTPDIIWSIGNSFLAGRYKNSKRVLFIWDLQKKELVSERRFIKLEGPAEEDPEDVFFRDLMKVNDETICFITRNVFSEESSVVIYNWRKDNFIAKCEIDAEDICGIANDELYIELFDSIVGTDIRNVTIPLKRALLNQDEKKVHELKWSYFGKSFMELERKNFLSLENKKNAVLAFTCFFPHCFFIMRKRNWRLEILKHLKRELAGFYHPYLIQEITEFITG